MSNTQHTPGPWIYDDRYVNVIAEDGRAIAGRPAWSSLSPDSEEADARLIAAAPELLEACEAALFALDCAINLQGLQLLIPTADKVRAAIAKAKGEASR
jgi:hypothetical protein